MDSLESFHPAVTDLPLLKTINCSCSSNLKSPPYSVCQQGLTAIRQYQTDLAGGNGIERPIVSAVVIGNRMAGKTSLIRSLKEQKRELTYRDSLSEDDETTRVFEVNEIPLQQEEVTLRMFDYGGDKVYHLSYQLTIRPSYIPIVVVNLEQFDELSSSEGVYEATRQLCMEYLSHLYLPCTKLGPPFLVLTHADRLPPDKQAIRQNELLEAVEQLRDSMIQEEQSYSANQLLQKVVHFSRRDKPIFSSEHIFVFTNDFNEVRNIRSLLVALLDRCKDSCVPIPFIWERIAIFIENQVDLPFVLIKDLLKRFPTESVRVVVRYMHNEGRLFWFERESCLQAMVFHKVSEVIAVIAKLFNHRSDVLWKQRQADFQPFSYGGQRVNRHKYSSLVRDFGKTGIIDDRLLADLYAEQQFPKDVAISLLQTFYLICGPIQTAPQAKFIIPYLSSDVTEPEPPTTDSLRLQLSVHFVGLPPPSYVYHVLVVSFLKMFADDMRNHISASHNGATVIYGVKTTRLLHNHKAREMVLFTDAPPEHLASAWKQNIDIIETILKKLKSVWGAAHPVCKFFCAHCIYTGEDSPNYEEDPDWYATPEDPETDPPLSRRLMLFPGVRPVSCCSSDSNGKATVPSPLRFPCTYSHSSSWQVKGSKSGCPNCIKSPVKGNSDSPQVQ